MTGTTVSHRPFVPVALLALILTSSSVFAQFGDGSVVEKKKPAKKDRKTASVDPTAHLDMGTMETEQWKVGVKITAKGGNCSGLFATIPVPTEWEPEQIVRVIKEDFSSEVRSVKFRTIDGGVKQMLVNIPNLPAGKTAHALITYEVDRHPTKAPEDTSGFELPVKKRLPRQLKKYLAASPFIEVRNRQIRSVAKDLKDPELEAWEQVEKIYDWVRENVEYENGPLKGALAALRDKNGDCEELTSLFIALCRSMDIPARTVWVPDHCYPEFYLQDAEGNGQWFPCQAAGARAFGSMYETRPVLQKGDNFKVPEKKDRQRYVSEFLKGLKSNGKPVVEFIRESSKDGQVNVK